jgi:hypothetical protein
MKLRSAGFAAIMQRPQAWERTTLQGDADRAS